MSSYLSIQYKHDVALKAQLTKDPSVEHMGRYLNFSFVSNAVTVSIQAGAHMKSSLKNRSGKVIVYPLWEKGLPSVDFVGGGDDEYEIQSMEVAVMMPQEKSRPTATRPLSKAQALKTRLEDLLGLKHDENDVWEVVDVFDARMYLRGFVPMTEVEALMRALNDIQVGVELD